MDGLEFMALLAGGLVLLALFHPVLAIFFAVLVTIAGIIVIANK